MSQEALNAKLISAIEQNDMTMLIAALDEGAVLNIDRSCQNTMHPLSLAARNNRVAMIELMIERGADIHDRDDLAFRWAAMNYHLDAMTCLVEHGANVRADNSSALHSATLFFRLDLVHWLIDRGADYHVLDTWNEGIETLSNIHNRFRTDDLGYLYGALKNEEWPDSDIVEHCTSVKAIELVLKYHPRATELLSKFPQAKRAKAIEVLVAPWEGI